MAMLARRMPASSAIRSMRSLQVRRLATVQVKAVAGEAPVRILGISGSLRQGSANTGMLRAAAKRLPPGVTLEIADVSQLPLYNDDLWQGRDTANDDAVLPEAVRRLRAQVKAADAIIFANPEYNGSVTPALKNALDWCSKGPNVVTGKAGAIVGAGGSAGTARASAHLRNIATYLNVMWAPFWGGEIQLNRYAGNSFDAKTGDVVDQALEDRIANLVASLVDWSRKLKSIQ